MRPLGVIGILLVILGVFMFLGEGRFATRRDVLQVGDVKITASEHQSFPPWVSGLVIALGAVLIVSGTRRRAP